MTSFNNGIDVEGTRDLEGCDPPVYVTGPVGQLVTFYDSGANFVQESYVGFILPIPPGATITSATLSATQQNANSSTAAEIAFNVADKVDVTSAETIFSFWDDNPIVLFSSAGPPVAVNEIYSIAVTDGVQDFIDLANYLEDDYIVFYLATTDIDKISLMEGSLSPTQQPFMLAVTYTVPAAPRRRQDTLLPMGPI